MHSSKSRHLHIVSFDVPFPPNYGGVIDVFYKIKALVQLGVRVTLHTWQYGNRGERNELNEFCDKVYYYKRNRFMNPFSGSIPYIVKTRYSAELFENLNADNDPVIFEGLHTTAPLYYGDLNQDKKVIVRNHNIESDYYRLLAQKETGTFKKTYLKKDAQLLETYEDVLSKADAVAAISENDHEKLRAKCNSFYVPAFHPNEEIKSLVGKGNYCLYHGNLAVAENSEAALWLVNEVFSNSNLKLIVAGNTAPSALKQAIAKYNNVELREKLKISEFDELIANAQINVLPTFQPTGIKLKLLNALYKGRHCLFNSNMVNNTGLEGLCTVANTSHDFKNSLNELMTKGFTTEMIKNRGQVIQPKFGNLNSAKLLLKSIDF